MVFWMSLSVFYPFLCLVLFHKHVITWLNIIHCNMMIYSNFLFILIFFRKKNAEQRQNVISELVYTEKEYVRDLKITYETFNLHNPSILEARGIDVKVVFGNILEVSVPCTTKNLWIMRHNTKRANIIEKEKYQSMEII